MFPFRARVLKSVIRKYNPEIETDLGYETDADIEECEYEDCIMFKVMEVKIPQLDKVYAGKITNKQGVEENEYHDSITTVSNVWAIVGIKIPDRPAYRGSLCYFTDLEFDEKEVLAYERMRWQNG